jgi:hypothetical protein
MIYYGLIASLVTGIVTCSFYRYITMVVPFEINEYYDDLEAQSIPSGQMDTIHTESSAPLNRIYDLNYYT